MTDPSREMSTRTQLLVMLSLPLLALVAYALITVWGAISELRSVHLSTAAVEAAIASSQLIHEQQNERGLSAGFWPAGVSSSARNWPARGNSPTGDSTACARSPGA